MVTTIWATAVLTGRDMPRAGDVIAAGEGLGHGTLLKQNLDPAFAPADQPEMGGSVRKALPVCNGTLYGLAGGHSVFIYHVKIFFQCFVSFRR